MAGARVIFIFCLTLLITFTSRVRESCALVLKIASVAPDESAWGEAYRKLSKIVEKLTGGSLSIKHYPGGVMGDEPSLVRKIKIGQLHGAALTELGLGMVLPQTRLFNLVLFYRSFDEWDHVRDNLLEDYREIARKNGFELIGWTEIGPVRIFSKKKLLTFQDYKKAKLWVWAGDPFVKLMAEKGLGVTPVVLTLPEVMPGLQTGMIDTFYCPAYAALALQWYKEAKYVSSMIAGYTSGAVILSKKVYNKLTPQQKEALDIGWKEVFPWLKKEVRKLNEDSYRSFIASGLEPVDIPPAVLNELKRRTVSLNEQAAEMVGAKSIYHKILLLLKTYRNSHYTDINKK